MGPSTDPSDYTLEFQYNPQYAYPDLMNVDGHGTHLYDIVLVVNRASIGFIEIIIYDSISGSQIADHIEPACCLLRA